MTNIFSGLFLIFINFDLTLGNSKIGLFPDFIGYIIMVKGLVEMGGESWTFMKVKPWAIIMAVYTGILYFIELFGISESLGAIYVILSLASVVISLYISYTIVVGVEEVELKYRTDLNVYSLRFTWKILAVFEIAAFVAALLMSMVTIICVIVTIIAAVYFLVAFNKSKNSYYLMKARLS